jgi:peroxiredoxin Q/BCP
VAAVAVGDPAPDFDLPGTGDRRYRLADYAGRRLILAFYPGDFTTVCTKQLCSYRDGEERLAAMGVELVGISPQDVDSHERFATQYRLPMPLLADTGGRVASAYGVKAGPLVRRSIFLIDGEGIVRYRHVALLGLSYQSLDDLEQAVAKAA